MIRGRSVVAAGCLSSGKQKLVLNKDSEQVCGYRHRHSFPRKAGKRRKREDEKKPKKGHTFGQSLLM